MGRRHAEVFLDLLRGEGFAQPNPQPMFPNPPGLLRLEPYSQGLRARIWWGDATTAGSTTLENCGRGSKKAFGTNVSQDRPSAGLSGPASTIAGDALG